MGSEFIEPPEHLEYPYRISLVLRSALALMLLAVAGSSATVQAAGDSGGTPNRATQQAMRILESHRAQHEFPGAVAALHDPNGESVLVTSGTATPDDAGPAVDANVPWFIGSTTKTFVAVVVLQLAQEAKLDLDQSVERWYPDLPRAADITVRQLLQHTSGLNEYLDAEIVQRDAQRRWTPDELLAIAVSREQLADPGVGHHYSNTNYIVLGGIVEKITSRPWYAEVRTRILDPLGMSRTGYPDETLALQVGPGYGVENGRFVDYSRRWHHSLGGSAGALYSTASDLLRFIRALLEGNLLDDEHNAAMRTFIPAEDIGYVRHEYGLGLGKYVLNNLTLYGHMGSASAHSSFIGFDPESRVAVAALTNCEEPESTAMMAAELVGKVVRRDVSPPPMPAATLEYSYYPFAKLKDSDGTTLGDVQITSLDISVARTLVFNEGKTRLTHGIEFQRLQFDYRDWIDKPSLESVYAISMNATIVQQLTESWGLLLIASPGYADDFRGKASTDAFTLTLIGAATYRVSENLEFGLGVAGISLFGESLILPVGSVDWQINERLSFNAILPVKAELTWLPIDRLGVRASLELDGNSYHGDKNRYDVGNPQVNYSAISAELATRWFILPWLHVTVHGGYTIFRRFEFSDGRSTVQDGKFDLNNGGVVGIDFGIGG